MMEPDFTARVHLIAPGQGGRSSPVVTSPFHCIVVIGDANHDVRLSFAPPFVLGEERVVGINVLDPAMLYKVHPGLRFMLRELRTIGSGSVIDIGAVQPVS